MNKIIYKHFVPILFTIICIVEMSLTMCTPASAILFVGYGIYKLLKYEY